MRLRARRSNQMPSLHECATANNNDLAGQLLRQLYEKGGASAVREALMHEIDGKCAAEAAMRAGAVDLAVRFLRAERDAADEIVRRCEVLETKAAACDQEAFRQVEMRSVERAQATVQQATLVAELQHMEEELHPPPLQLSADVIWAVACACSGPEALAWCAACKEHRANRPPLQMLVIDDWNLRMGQSAADLLAPIDKQVKISFGLEPRGLDTTGAPRAPIARLSLLPSDAIVGMRLYMRPKSKSHVHTMLARISLVHASEITHLSLQTFHKPQEDKGYSYMHGFLPLPSGRRTRQEVGRHGRHLTSLRVLEVIQAEVVDPRHRSTACVMATKTLIENTATTLRTLSIVSTIDELDSRELNPVLRAVGPHLHYLSIFAVEAKARMKSYRLSGAQVDLSWSGCVLEFVDNATRQEDDEMETEMLQNAAEGLCISLKEPARILAHLPRPDRTLPNANERMKSVLSKCGTYLADVEWMR